MMRFRFWNSSVQNLFLNRIRSEHLRVWGGIPRSTVSRLLVGWKSPGKQRWHQWVATKPQIKCSRLWSRKAFRPAELFGFYLRIPSKNDGLAGPKTDRQKSASLDHVNLWSLRIRVEKSEHPAADRGPPRALSAARNPLRYLAFSFLCVSSLEFKRSEKREANIWQTLKMRRNVSFFVFV